MTSNLFTSTAFSFPLTPVAPLIVYTEACATCGRVRKGEDVFIECACTLARVYPIEREQALQAELNKFDTLARALVAAHKARAEVRSHVVKLFAMIRALSRDADRIIFRHKDGTIFRAMRDFVRDVSGASYQSPDAARFWLYLPLSIIARFGCDVCLYVPNGMARCKSETSGLICSQHVCLLYIMHNELLTAGLVDSLVRAIIYYIMPEYDFVSACLPGTSHPAKRRLAEVEN